MESLSRISTLLETARDLTLEAAQSASASGRHHTTTPSPTETKKLLNSRLDREVLDGLRKVITMMSQGTDCSTFFADVVKNVASPSLEIKKLVYIYLLRYAESEPDLALLSINTIQKALTDPSAVVRALAIRVMAGIRVPVISQIVALGIRRCAGDMSPYVRKAAAVAIPKCYRLDPGTLPALVECLGVLLGDGSFYVVGAAVVAFEGVCPKRWELLHRHYRALARMLIDMDEWGQLAVLRVLTGYARANFPARQQKAKKAAAKGTGAKTGDGFYSDESGDEAASRKKAAAMDPDLELLLRSCIPLLQSRNSAVIVAVARLYTHLAPASSLPTVAGPLISLLRAPADIQHIALLNIVSIALKTPHPFTPYSTHFLVHASDPPHIWKLKIELLTLIFPHTPTRTKNLILGELEYFAHTHDTPLVREAVRAIGRCAQSETRNAARCLKLLMRQVEAGEGTLVAESLTVIRHIILQNPGAHSGTVVRLAKALDTAVNPSARASIIWLVGEFAGFNGGDNIAADTLRLLAKTFPLEGEAAKLQIVLLAAKVYAHYLDRTQSGAPAAAAAQDDNNEEEQEEKHPIALLFSYITLLARYDLSYDLRDRARLYKAILSTPSSTPLATLLLLAPKPTPLAPSPSSGREKYTIGSAAMVVGEGEDVSGYEPLEDWVSESRAPSPSVRDVIVEGETEKRGVAVSKKSGGVSPGMAATPERSPVWRPEGVKVQVKEKPETLEDFFKESEEEVSEEDSEEESEEESGEEESEEEDDDDDDDEEEEESEDEGHEGSKLLTQEK